jgi:hypothetical protein
MRTIVMKSSNISNNRNIQNDSISDVTIAPQDLLLLVFGLVLASSSTFLLISSMASRCSPPPLPPPHPHPPPSHVHYL